MELEEEREEDCSSILIFILIPVFTFCMKSKQQEGEYLLEVANQSLVPRPPRVEHIQEEEDPTLTIISILDLKLAVEGLTLAILHMV